VVVEQALATQAKLPGQLSQQPPVGMHRPAQGVVPLAHIHEHWLVDWSHFPGKPSFIGQSRSMQHAVRAMHLPLHSTVSPRHAYRHCPMARSQVAVRPVIAGQSSFRQHPRVQPASEEPSPGLPSATRG
jgi:hypothetical protein